MRQFHLRSQFSQNTIDTKACTNTVRHFLPVPCQHNYLAHTGFSQHAQSSWCFQP